MPKRKKIIRKKKCDYIRSLPTVILKYIITFLDQRPLAPLIIPYGQYNWRHLTCIRNEDGKIDVFLRSCSNSYNVASNVSDETILNNFGLHASYWFGNPPIFMQCNTGKLENLGHQRIDVEYLKRQQEEQKSLHQKVLKEQSDFIKEIQFKLQQPIQ